MFLYDDTDDTFWFVNCFGQLHPYHMKNFSVHHSSFVLPFPPFCQTFVQFFSMHSSYVFVTNIYRREWRIGYGTRQIYCHRTSKPFSCSPFVECNESHQGNSSVETTGRKDQMDGSIRLGSITYRERQSYLIPSVILMYLFPTVIIIGFLQTVNFCVNALFSLDR